MSAVSNSRPSQDRTEATELHQQSLKTVTQPGLDEPSRDSGVNKKKQKRRMKEAAKKAAESNDSVGSQISQMGNQMQRVSIDIQ